MGDPGGGDKSHQGYGQRKFAFLRPLIPGQGVAIIPPVRTATHALPKVKIFTHPGTMEGKKPQGKKFRSSARPSLLARAPDDDTAAIVGYIT
ncbi:MAG: hypothetical protein AB7D33_10195, partial [Sphingobium sp.]